MIGDLMFILVYLVTEFLNYILGYKVVFGATVTKAKSRWLAAILLVLVLHLLLYLAMGKEMSCNVSMVSMLVIPFLLLKPVMKRNIILYPFIVIGVSVIGVCASFILATVLGISEDAVIDNAWTNIFCQSISILFMILIVIYRKRRRIDNFPLNLNWKQYLILYVVVISLFFLLAPIQVLSEKIPACREISYVGVSSSVVCIVLVVVTVGQAISATRERQLQERNTMNEKYMELQKEYYDQLLNQDEKMRRFRHDMNAHIQILKAYCDQQETGKIKDYLETIMDESAIYAFRKYTNNWAVDAVLHSLVSEAEGRKIQINFQGHLPKKTKVEDYDLCTIIYNLMKNAIEASEQIEDASRRSIQIEMGAYDLQVYILIKNQVDRSNVSLLTAKEDQKNHGLGLGNVKRAVEKYNGCFHVEFEDGWFSAEVNI